MKLVDPGLANSLAKLESFVEPSDSDDVKASNVHVTIYNADGFGIDGHWLC